MQQEDDREHDDREHHDAVATDSTEDAHDPSLAQMLDTCDLVR